MVGNFFRKVYSSRPWETLQDEAQTADSLTRTFDIVAPAAPELIPRISSPSAARTYRILDDYVPLALRTVAAVSVGITRRPDIALVLMPIAELLQTSVCLTYREFREALNQRELQVDAAINYALEQREALFTLIEMGCAPGMTREPWQK